MANELNATGTWKGGTDDITIELQLVQTGSNVTGSGKTAMLGHSVDYPVRGTASGSSVDLDLKGPWHNGKFTFKGTYNPPPNTLTGENITLRRS